MIHQRANILRTNVVKGINMDGICGIHRAIAKRTFNSIQGTRVSVDIMWCGESKKTPQVFMCFVFGPVSESHVKAK